MKKLDFLSQQIKPLSKSDLKNRLSVYHSENSTGNKLLTFEHLQRDLMFCNDADREIPPLQLDTSCTVRVMGPDGLDQSFLVYYGEVIDERLVPFNTVEITSNYKWRIIVRSGMLP